jgi:AraC family transcriptional regulator of adaptative response / DNA-3-methyladenine glycosylase II
VAGVEDYVDGTYRRSLRLPHGYGVVSLSAAPRASGPAYVQASLHLSDLRDLTTAVARCRQLLDLDADPVAIDRTLAADPLLSPLVEEYPGRRVPGAVDEFEIAVRAIIGQQVSVVGARTIAGRLVAAAGDVLPESDGTITHLFPTPGALVELAGTTPEVFSMPHGRRRALVALASALERGEIVIDPGSDPLEVRRRLVEIAGIGPWTAEYVAMRALHDPDAFMATDLGIRRAGESLGLREPSSLARAANAWRPWRSYAMAHLWAMPVNSLESPELSQRKKGS